MTAEKSITGCGNVFLDLGFPQDEAELLQAQAHKMIESAKETQYLLSDPANAQHLAQSIAQYRAGKAQEHELLDTE